MMRVFAAMVAVAAPAMGVPVTPAGQVSFEQTLSLGTGMSDFSGVEGALSALVAQASGTDAAATVSASAGRRLQAGGTTLSITYVVSCGDSCAAVAAVRPVCSSFTLSLARTHPSPPAAGPTGTAAGVRGVWVLFASTSIRRRASLPPP